MKGSCAFYSPIWPYMKSGFFWSKPYPETSGYLIETLIDYQNYDNQLELYDYISSIVHWLLDIQLPSGSFPGGLGDKGRESFFNTGQILLGLIKYYKISPSFRIEESIIRAYEWLLSAIDTNGLVCRGHYIQNFSPDYYSRVLWPMLMIEREFNLSNSNKILLCIKKILSNFDNDSCIFKAWSFNRDKPAFTHTIAYTLRGLLESSRLLKDEFISIEIGNIVYNSFAKILTDLNNNNFIIGALDKNGRSDNSFICVTGHFQLSIVSFLLNKYSLLNDNYFSSKKLFNTAKEGIANSSNFFLLKGGINGSIPFHSKYLRFRQPNWAVKFYLDNLLLLLQNNKLYKE